MTALGAAVRPLPPIRGRELARPEERIEQLEGGIYSYTWRVDEEARHRGARAARRWAEERLGPLSEPRELPVEITYRAYDLPPTARPV
jgi:hypothetical protein